jgi:hypothetical protein
LAQASGTSPGTCTHKDNGKEVEAIVEFCKTGTKQNCEVSRTNIWSNIRPGVLDYSQYCKWIPQASGSTQTNQPTKIRSGRKCSKIGTVASGEVCTADNDCKSVLDSCCEVQTIPSDTLVLGSAKTKVCHPFMAKSKGLDFGDKYFTNTEEGCKGRTGLTPRKPLEVGSYLSTGDDCHQKCYEHPTCSSYEKTSAGCELYDDVCSDGDDLDASAEYYITAAHDKQTFDTNKCTHKAASSTDIDKVNECKGKTAESDCQAVAHCMWRSPPVKFRENVECGTPVDASNPPLIEFLNSEVIKMPDSSPKNTWQELSADAASKGGRLPSLAEAKSILAKRGGPFTYTATWLPVGDASTKDWFAVSLQDNEFELKPDGWKAANSGAQPPWGDDTSVATDVKTQHYFIVYETITLEQCNQLCIRNLAQAPCTQFLWNGDAAVSSSKGKCQLYKPGCTYDAPSVTNQFNAYFASGYEEPSRVPEVCTHLPTLNFDPIVVKECKAYTKTECTDGANAGKCQWNPLCNLKLQNAGDDAAPCTADQAES